MRDEKRPTTSDSDEISKDEDRAYQLAAELMPEDEGVIPRSLVDDLVHKCRRR